MTQWPMTRECPMPDAQRPDSACGRCGLGIGGLVIDWTLRPWALVIHLLARLRLAPPATGGGNPVAQTGSQPCRRLATGGPADCQSAKQQIANLRYTPATGQGWGEKVKVTS